MRDDLANIVVLVLPAGATTGSRIVLDGIEGEIEVYDSNNVLVGLISSTAIIKALHSSGSFAALVPSGNASALQLRPPSIVGHSFSSFGQVYSDTVGTDNHPFTNINSPRIDGNDGTQITLFGEDDDGNDRRIFTQADLLEVDNDLKVDSDAEILGDLTVGDDIQYSGRSHDRGFLGEVDSIGSSTSFIGTTETTCLAVTHTFKAGRCYRLNFHGYVEGEGAGATSTISVRARQTSVGGTNLGLLWRLAGQGVTILTAGGYQHIRRAAAAGDLTDDILITLTGGSNTVGNRFRMFGDSTSKSWTFFEDIGTAGEHTEAFLIT
jgi:hypothetical protein